MEKARYSKEGRGGVDHPIQVVRTSPSPRDPISGLGMSNPYIHTFHHAGLLLLRSIEETHSTKLYGETQIYSKEGGRRRSSRCWIHYKLSAHPLPRGGPEQWAGDVYCVSPKDWTIRSNRGNDPTGTGWCVLENKEIKDLDQRWGVSHSGKAFWGFRGIIDHSGYS
jgi:hypothetical protein